MPQAQEPHNYDSSDIHEFIERFIEEAYRDSPYSGVELESRHVMEWNGSLRIIDLEPWKSHDSNKQRYRSDSDSDDSSNDSDYGSFDYTSDSC